ncbi:MAG: GNAT family N-acetyltransferase [Chloroflexi bacterium]|nr:GNAT family N-acetyltransferase [Chloroflexota bacterium]
MPTSESAETVVRLCREEDIERVTALYKRWEEEAITWGLVADTAEGLRGKLGPFFLVAERAGELVGFVAARVRHADPGDLAVFPAGADCLEVEDLYVAEHVRDEGIGTQLMERLLAEAKRRGIEHSTVFSATKDVARIVRFYEQFGHRLWGIQMFK